MIGGYPMPGLVDLVWIFGIGLLATVICLFWPTSGSDNGKK
jgi:hypothetical protein